MKFKHYWIDIQQRPLASPQVSTVKIKKSKIHSTLPPVRNITIRGNSESLYQLWNAIEQAMTSRTGKSRVQLQSTKNKITTIHIFRLG
jgi:hypothetical protein